jgi:single-strand DNA-binding protein
MALPSISGEFTVVADPDLRFTPSGQAVADIRLVSNSQKRDPNDNTKWIDDKTYWATGVVWGKMAENLVESVKKSDLVTVTGKPYTESYDKDGVKRSVEKIQVDSIGPSMKFRTTPHGAQAQQAQPQQDQWAQPSQWGGQPPQNWGNQPPAQQPQQAQQPPQQAPQPWQSQPQAQPQYAQQPGAQGQPQYQQGPPQGQPYQDPNAPQF